MGQETEGSLELGGGDREMQMDLRFAPLIHDVSHTTVIPKGWQYGYWSYPRVWSYPRLYPRSYPRVFGHTQGLAVLVLGPPLPSSVTFIGCPLSAQPVRH